MASDLDRLAAAHGIVRSYHAIDGTTRHAPDGAVRALLQALGAGEGKRDVPLGYPDRWPPEPEAPKGVACYLPPFLEVGRAWGITCQLYGLASGRNWGIGDFEDLARLGEFAARFGADFIGVNPLHALFLAEPQRASPFSPSARNALNPLYIAVDRVEGFLSGEDMDEARLAALRSSPLVDYPGVAACKLEALRRIHARMRERDRKAVLAFAAGSGGQLERFALFEALSLNMIDRGFHAGWLSWPEEFRDPEGEAVGRFACDNRDEIDFQLWLQWTADRQLGAAAERLHRAGMRIGLYLDLAVGTAPDGAATWSDRTLTVVGAEIGAPPDMFNPRGQSWGLAPVSPAEIAAREFRPIRLSYEAIMRHAGALRIDHAMSLYRLFWIPAGFSAADGAYLLYPMAGMLRTLADVSRQRRALVIGEDLGVVPEGFREAMSHANLLGYRLFYFERNAQGFVPSRQWPRSALACVGSHDTATLAGWWSGSDIDVRLKIGLYDKAAAARALGTRKSERQQAIDLLHAQGQSEAGETFDAAVAAGVHLLVARTPAHLMAAQMEDLLGLTEQPNIPGTTGEHPNWRRRLPLTLEKLEEQPVLVKVLKAISRERPRRS